MAGWILSYSLGPVVLGIDNGFGPVFPSPIPGALNIEVFTFAGRTVGEVKTSTSGFIVGVLNGTFTVPPNSEPGFQASIWDPGPLAPLDGGFLAGALLLGGGDYEIVNYGGGTLVRLGSGNQTVVGGQQDRLFGGLVSVSTNQVLSALAGSETVVGGIGNESIWGGANDSIVAGSGANQQIVVTGAATTVVAGLSGNAVVALAAQDTVTSLPGSTQNIVIAAGPNNLIDLTGNTAASASAVIGANGDTITSGGGVTNIEGAGGGMLVRVGAAGTTNLSGSTSQIVGNTVTGGAGGFNFAPGAVAGKGDLIDLSGGTGSATINAFSFGATRIAAPDTILAGNGLDSVFGGDGDRIGTGSGSVVGGIHQWVHADTMAGATVGFGSNDTVVSTSYDTVAGTATRGTVPGTSSAQVTVTNFATATDYMFYQNETAATTSAIIASARDTPGPTPQTTLTLPDGTLLTLVGVVAAQLTPLLFKP